MLDRKSPPRLQEVRNHALPQPRVHTLDNGMKLYEMNMGTQDIVKLELVFHAGRWHEHQKLAAKVTAGLLRDGTADMSGAEIAERIDFYGASIRFPSNLDTAYVQLYALTKHLPNVLPVLAEILSAPAFPERDLELYLSRSIERYKEDQENNDTVAYRALTELMYGAHHPYGYNSSPELYQAIKREHLLEHFRNNYVAGNGFMMVSGRVDEEVVRLINTYLGKVVPAGQNPPLHFEITPDPKLHWHIKSEGSYQSAIRIGKRLFDRKHEDYYGMYVLNTVLGGYFGSRLMQNLRETQGYTYNVSSTLDSMMYDGYFMIGTEVKSDMTEAALEEIYLEMQRLRNEPIPQEELSMVRNYLLGTMLTAIDGPFNAASVRKMIHTHGLSDDYFTQLLHTIKTITAEELQALAQRHLTQEDCYQVVVG